MSTCFSFPITDKDLKKKEALGQCKLTRIDIFYYDVKFTVITNFKVTVFTMGHMSEAQCIY